MKTILKLTEFATYACNNGLAGNFFVNSNHVNLILAESSIWNLCVVAADGAQLQRGPCDAATAAAGAASNCVLAWLQCNGIMYFLLYIYKISRHGHVSCGLTPHSASLSSAKFLLASCHNYTAVGSTSSSKQATTTYLH
jgi:hypothetical protein